MRPCCSIRVVCDPELGVPQTDKDLIAAFIYTRSLPSIRHAPRDRAHLTTLIKAISRAAACIRKSADEVIPLDKLVDMHDELVSYVEGLNLGSKNAVDHVCDKNKALWHAHEIGWTSARYELHLSWMDIRHGFGGKSCGCGTIIQQALDEGLLPDQIDEPFFGRWRQAKGDKHCSPMTIQEEERVFYRKMRNSGRADRFPHLDLAVRAPEPRVPKEEDLPDSFREDLDRIDSWKTDAIVKGRPASLRVKSRAARTMRNALKGIYGFAVDRKHLAIARVPQLFDDPEIVCGYIDMLSNEYGWLATSIHAHLSSLHCLTCTYPGLNRRKYPRFTARMRRLRKAPRYRIDEGKDESCVLYETLFELPRGIRAKRRASRNLSDEDIAWMIHDELFASWSLYLPWRFSNIAGCGIIGPAPINIIYAELPIEMREDPDLPQWVKRALKRDEHQPFLQYIFWKTQCKNKWAVRGVVPQELLSLYHLYTERYRKVLVKGKEDPGYLFLNRSLKRMQYDDWYSLYTRLTLEFLPHAVRPHLTRDIFAEHWLRLGRSLTGLQKMLWHRYIVSTIGYARRLNASYGTVVLEHDLVTNREHALAA